MTELVCKLEGLLQDNKLPEAENLYREFAKLLPVGVRTAFESELFRRNMERSVIIKRNHALFKHVD